MILLLLALLSGFPSPTASPVPTRTVTLTPVETASAFGAPCAAKVQPPFAHPSGSLFVGGFIVAGAQAGAGPMICSAYQGLARFDLDGLDAASIVKATVFYDAKQGYEPNGSTLKKRTPCVGSIGVTNQAWSPDEKITPVVSELETYKPSHGSFKSPPVDITPLLKAHLAEVKTNGLVFDGTVDTTTERYCYTALDHIELRLEITGLSL